MKRTLLCLFAAMTLCLGTSSIAEAQNRGGQKPPTSQTNKTQNKPQADKPQANKQQNKPDANKQQTNKNKGKGNHDNFNRIPSDPNGEVYITNTGEKYHRPWCDKLKGKQTRRVSKDKAKRAGLKSCKKCKKNNKKK